MTSPISSVGSTSNTNQAQTGGNSQGMSQLTNPNTFLTLLVDEMKYQDPLNPTSSQNLMAQLAQLSQVEQMNSISSAMQMSQASGLIGKSITGVNAAGKTISGTVTGVANSNNGPLVYVNGESIGLSSVETIGTTG